jgi:phosphate butyryltransferase
MIRTLGQMEELVRSSQRKHRLAVAWALDTNTLSAVSKAVDNGIVRAFLIGHTAGIVDACNAEGIDHTRFDIIESASDNEAVEKAVAMAKGGDADIVMKGLVGTDKFLKEVMNKERGLMLPGAVLSYVCAVQVPAYDKLLFITDPAVIPFPTLDQKIAMARYSIEMAGRFGIKRPKIALISATEKVSSHFSSSSDYTTMTEMAAKGEFGECIMDGPLDIFLACDPESPGIKGVNTPVDGEADILLFPSLEACNPFYKGLMLFGEGELAGLIRGTEKPVVVMSRSESELSKYYCIVLSCLMA